MFFSNILSDIFSGIYSDILSVILLAFNLTFIRPFIVAFCLASILTFYLAFFPAYILTSLLAFHLASFQPFILSFYMASILTSYSDILSLRVQARPTASSASWAGNSEFGPMCTPQSPELAIWCSGSGVLHCIQSWRYGDRVRRERRWCGSEEGSE